MSDSQPGPPQPDPADPEDQPSAGPNLTLIYSLVALALAAAIGLAIMIVMPFYQRR
jgi:hypothetical protein